MKKQPKEILYEFLRRWQIEDLENMSITDYVGIGDKDTFCQWVETRTKELGNIKGSPSIKFGIYKRGKPEKKPTIYNNDEVYSWEKSYGADSEEAFQRIKNDILKIVEYADKGDFEKNDQIKLRNVFKWKVAFLYSNERLVPIFKKEVLHKIGRHFGLEVNRNTKVSTIQELMIANKPTNQDVHNFMRKYYFKFSKEVPTHDESDNSDNSNKQRTKKRKRKGTKSRNTKSQTRTIHQSFVVEQKHNKIQEALRNKLEMEYGEKNVILEENYVDVKLIQDKFIGFYEVKSSPYASECIKEALGQILLYVNNDENPIEKKIYVVGQYPPNDQDKQYIEFIKKNLNIEFDYINVELK